MLLTSAAQAPQPPEPGKPDVPPENLTARAAQHFQQARQAYAQGEPARAAALFEQAASEAPHAASYFNAALAWEESGERARAADDYDLALDLEQLAPDQEKDARIRLAALTKLLGTLILVEPRDATVQVGHLEKVSIPVTVHLPPGSHRVVVTSARGDVLERTVSLRAGEVKTLALEPPLLAMPDLAPRERTAPLPAPPGLSAQRIAAWATLGTAVAASGAAVGLGVGALNARATYQQSGSTSASAYRQAVSLRTWTNVSWGAAALLGGAGLALLFIPPPVNRGPVQVGYGPTSVSLQGSF